MSQGEFQRARSSEQKEERRRLLLETAAPLLAEKGALGSLSLNELARHAGMAKSNIYRYFESREALLLELMQREWGLWFAQLEQELRLPVELNQAQRLEQLISVIASTLTSRPLLCQLTSALPSVIEHNISAEGIHAFKLSSIDFLDHLAARLHSYCAELSLVAYQELVQQTLLVITGLWPHAYPSEAVGEALSDPRLAAFRHDFERDLNRALIVYARGLRACPPA